MEASKEYGNCTDIHKQDFLYGVDRFLEFLKSTTNDIVTSSIKFEVDHQLFKGFLLVAHQIEATSKRRDKVAEVENYFYQWMKQIKTVVVRGHQIVHETPESGPLAELEHWRSMLTMFNNVVEFTDTQSFQNHMKCLKLSRSKLIKVGTISWCIGLICIDFLIITAMERN